MVWRLRGNYMPIDEYVAHIQSVTAADVQRVARAISQSFEGPHRDVARDAVTATRAENERSPRPYGAEPGTLISRLENGLRVITRSRGKQKPWRSISPCWRALGMKIPTRRAPPT